MKSHEEKFSGFTQEDEEEIRRIEKEIEERLGLEKMFKEFEEEIEKEIEEARMKKRNGDD